MCEETTRVPLLIRWPGHAPAGKVIRTQAGSCDISPTILDYLGLQARRAIHGASLRRYIEGREDSKRAMFCEREKDPGETANLIEDPKAGATRTEMHRAGCAKCATSERSITRHSLCLRYTWPGERFAIIIYLALGGTVLKAPVGLKRSPSTVIWPPTGVSNSTVPRLPAVTG
jgi:hypothetical protein